MADAPEVFTRHSTLEAVEHHPQLSSQSAKFNKTPHTNTNDTFSTLEISEEQHHETEKYPVTAPKEEYSTLESKHHDAGSDQVDAEPAAERPKESWKKRKVCGIPGLFLLLGVVALVVVIAAVVGGVVGSRAKDDKPTSTTTSTSATSTGTAATSTRTSDAQFEGSTDMTIYTAFDGGPKMYLQNASAHAYTPSDGVFIGELAAGATYPKLDLKMIPQDVLDEFALDQIVTNNTKAFGLFWARVFETDDAIQIDMEVYNSIFSGDRPNKTRTDIPLQLKPFNKASASQIWYLGTQDAIARTDQIRNNVLTGKNWTLGVGADNFTAAMVLIQPDGEPRWNLMNLTNTANLLG